MKIRVSGSIVLLLLAWSIKIASAESLKLDSSLGHLCNVSTDCTVAMDICGPIPINWQYLPSIEEKVKKFRAKGTIIQCEPNPWVGIAEAVLAKNVICETGRCEFSPNLLPAK